MTTSFHFDELFVIRHISWKQLKSLLCTWAYLTPAILLLLLLLTVRIPVLRLLRMLGSCIYYAAFLTYAAGCVLIFFVSIQAGFFCYSMWLSVRDVKDKFLARRYTKAAERARNGRRTSSEVYHVAFLLNQLVPGDVVPLIMDYAEMWQDVRIAQDGVLNFPFDDRTGNVLMIGGFPKFLPLRSIRTLTFTVLSTEIVRYAAWKKLFGSTRNGYGSWFEATIFADALNASQQRIQTSALRVFQDTEYRDDNGHKYRFRVHIDWHYDEDVPLVKGALTGHGQYHEVAVAMSRQKDLWLSQALFREIDCQVAIVRKM